ncbi:hypothetical protein DHEL01_v212890 [Diaporthe helianthi]|uniref:Efflux pump antibiotic resistance protein n=1 Tax=Diaporthe helianthi TaxID=158607 RepID=A0A2P5HEQ6_DIAHE|nr:hypothetical protein DHEL01_v212890 [Diaporthe helianthi]
MSRPTDTTLGSFAITEALTILGFKDVHHGITSGPQDWPLISDACDAVFPVLPTYTGKTVTREGWDRLFGPCEAITDMGSFFALQLIEAYPDAKVILVERDVDSWYRSVEQAIIGTVWGWRADFFACFLAPLFGIRTGQAIRKVMLGFFEARNVSELRRNAKDKYRRHYAEIRAAVPPERLLNFELADGWEPLCLFLGKPVPDVPFPRNNSRDEYLSLVQKRRSMFLSMATWRVFKKALPWIMGAAGVACGYTALRRPDFIPTSITGGSELFRSA